MMQTILSITLLIVAAGFLFWNFGGKKLFARVGPAPESDKDCGPDCKCG